jgi:hypothetical protein
MPPQAPMRPQMQIDTSNLPIADFVVAGAGLLALIWSRLNWYKLTVGEGFYKASATGTGGIQWGSFIFLLFLLLFAGFVIANHFLNFVDLPMPVGLIYLGLAGLSLLFVLLGLVVKPSVGVSIFDVGYKMGMNWVMWVLMLIFNGAALAGAVMKVNEGK